MAELLVGISIGTESLKLGATLDQYARLRRQLQSLASILGPLPEFLADAEDGWAFWNTIKRHSHWSERRQFITEHFVDYYAKRLSENSSSLDFEASLARRDLVIEDTIGQGGFGTVYRATHMVLETARAVKVFDPSFFGGAESAIRRFAREAELLSTISHPSIVRFFDAGVAGGRPYIVTELIAGQNLQAYLDTHGPLSEREARVLFSQAAEALSFVHGRGVFHRDIKPTNLMWNGERLTILDFGAGVALTHALTTRLTTTAIGTSGFVAPELIEEPTLTAPSVDVYSLGVTVHKSLTNRLPYPIDAAKYLREAGVSDVLSAVVVRCMMPSDVRYSTAAEVSVALASLPPAGLNRFVDGVRVVVLDDVAEASTGDEFIAPRRPPEALLAEILRRWSLPDGTLGSEWYLYDPSSRVYIYGVADLYRWSSELVAGREAELRITTVPF